MAQLVEKSDHLKKKYRAWHLAALLSTVLCIGFFLLWMGNILFFRSFSPVFLAMVFVGFAVCGAVAGATYHKANGLRSGVAGETAICRIVEKLPAGYVGFQNVKIPFQGKESEIDMVIVGRTGVFAVEVKNRNGKISGDLQQTYWCQEKVGRGGTVYENSFYSPVKQVSTHVYRLANYLRSQGVQVFVEGAVYFSNPDTCVQISGQGGRVPVFSAARGGKEQLTAFVMGTGKNLPPKLVGQICKVLG